MRRGVRRKHRLGRRCRSDDGLYSPPHLPPHAYPLFSSPRAQLLRRRSTSRTHRNSKTALTAAFTCCALLRRWRAASVRSCVGPCEYSCHLRDVFACLSRLVFVSFHSRYACLSSNRCRQRLAPPVRALARACHAGCCAAQTRRHPRTYSAACRATSSVSSSEKIAMCAPNWEVFLL